MGNKYPPIKNKLSRKSFEDAQDLGFFLGMLEVLKRQAIKQQLDQVTSILDYAQKDVLSFTAHKLARKGNMAQAEAQETARIVFRFMAAFSDIPDQDRKRLLAELEKE